jgi:hypothetical protein
MRIRGMIELKKMLWEVLFNTQDNNYYKKKSFVHFEYAIYQSGPLDFPPGG